MRTYIVGDDRIEAVSVTQLVHRMHQTSFAPAADDRAFMRQVANRVKLQSGARVRSNTAKNFVADMVSAGMIKIESERREV
jgi:hypothetical protein